MQKKPIELVLKDYSSTLMALPGVVGTGQGEYEGEACIKVLVSKMSPGFLAQIPSVLDGYRVIVEETGEFRALSE